MPPVLPGFEFDPSTGRYYRVSNNAPVDKFKLSNLKKKNREDDQEKQLRADIDSHRNDSSLHTCSRFYDDVMNVTLAYHWDHRDLSRYNGCISQSQLNQVIDTMSKLYEFKTSPFHRGIDKDDLNSLMLKTQVHHFKLMKQMRIFPGLKNALALESCSTSIIFQYKISEEERYAMTICPERIFADNLFRKFDQCSKVHDIETIAPGMIDISNSLASFRCSLLHYSNDRIDNLQDGTFRTINGKSYAITHETENPSSSDLRKRNFEEMDVDHRLQDSFGTSNFPNNASDSEVHNDDDDYNPYNDDPIIEYTDGCFEGNMKSKLLSLETEVDLPNTNDNSLTMIKSLYRDSDANLFEAPLCVVILQRRGSKHHLHFCHHQKSSEYLNVLVLGENHPIKGFNGSGYSKHFKHKPGSRKGVKPYYTLSTKEKVTSFDVIYFEGYRLFAMGTPKGELFFGNIGLLNQTGELNLQKYDKFGASIVQIQFIKDGSDLYLLVSGLKNILKLYCVDPSSMIPMLLFQYKDYHNENRASENFKVEKQLFAIVSGKDMASREVKFYSLFSPNPLELKVDPRSNVKVSIPYKNEETSAPLFSWLRGNPGKSWEKDEFVDRLSFLVYENGQINVYC